MSYNLQILCRSVQFMTEVIELYHAQCVYIFCSSQLKLRYSKYVPVRIALYIMNTNVCQPEQACLGRIYLLFIFFLTLKEQSQNSDSYISYMYQYLTKTQDCETAKHFVAERLATRYFRIGLTGRLVFLF